MEDRNGCVVGNPIIGRESFIYGGQKGSKSLIYRILCISMFMKQIIEDHTPLSLTAIKDPLFPILMHTPIPLFYLTSFYNILNFFFCFGIITGILSRFCDLRLILFGLRVIFK